MSSPREWKIISISDTNILNPYLIHNVGFLNHISLNSAVAAKELFYYGESGCEKAEQNHSNWLIPILLSFVPLFLSSSGRTLTDTAVRFTLATFKNYFILVCQMLNEQMILMSVLNMNWTAQWIGYTTQH